MIHGFFTEGHISTIKVPGTHLSYMPKRGDALSFLEASITICLLEGIKDKNKKMDMELFKGILVRIGDSMVTITCDFSDHTNVTEAALNCSILNMIKFPNRITPVMMD